MKPDGVKSRFLEQLNAGGVSLASITPSIGIAAMLRYYAEERIDGCDLDADGDMLLFQWGSFDWGEGPHFDINITRQLIVGDDDEDEPLQLSLTFRFEPIDERDLGDGSKWCTSPNEVQEFRRFVVESIALRKLGAVLPLTVVLECERT